MVQADLVQVAYCEVAQLSMLHPTSLAVYCPPNCQTGATIMKKEWNIMEHKPATQHTRSKPVDIVKDNY
jgi:hypothetical protein